MIEMATSKAGHDKGRLYVITGYENDLVLLSDGDIRKISNPKKKKLKHIQIIKSIPENILSECENKKFEDTLIKRIIKLYKKG